MGGGKLFGAKSGYAGWPESQAAILHNKKIRHYAFQNDLLQLIMFEMASIHMVARVGTCGNQVAYARDQSLILIQHHERIFDQVLQVFQIFRARLVHFFSNHSPHREVHACNVTDLSWLFPSTTMSYPLIEMVIDRFS